MASLNKVQLIGFVGGEPKITTFDDGGKVAQFSLATTERAYTSKNGYQIPERTEWHNIVVNYGLADVADKYVHKGTMLYIEGKMHYRTYDSNGVTNRIAEVIADNMQMLSSKQDGF